MFQPRKDLKPDTMVKIQYKTEKDGWVTHYTRPFTDELVGTALAIINDQLTRYGYSRYRVVAA